MSAPVSTDPVTTSDTPTPKSGVGTGIRVVISFELAIAIGIFMLLWDGGYIPHVSIPAWMGSFIFTPLIAVVLGYGGNCLIQALSCGQVQWLLQLQRILIVPVPFLIIWGLLYMFPIMRWPIEGLAQQTNEVFRKGLSSGFYAFWIALYTQSIMNGGSQACPK
jgi:hypothetical protein